MRLAIVTALVAASLAGASLCAQAPTRAASVGETVDKVTGDYQSVNAEIGAIREAVKRLPAVASVPAAASVTKADSPPEATIDVSIQGPASVPSGGFALVGMGPADAVLRWRIEKPDNAAEPLRLRDESGSPVLAFFSPSGGRYVVTLTAQVPTDGLDPFGEATHVVVVGKVKPDDETDPDEDDTEPDDDTDPPDVAPFPADGLHVLIVYESAHAARLTEDQRAIIAGADIRGALDSAAPGRYRIYDQDADLQFAPKVWQDAMKVPRESLPWLLISNGKAGYSGPLDMTTATFRDLLTELK